MTRTTSIYGAVCALCTLGLAACSGASGPTGPAGPTEAQLTKAEPAPEPVATPCEQARAQVSRIDALIAKGKLDRAHRGAEWAAAQCEEEFDVAKGRAAEVLSKLDGPPPQPTEFPAHYGLGMAQTWFDRKGYDQAFAHALAAATGDSKGAALVLAARTSRRLGKKPAETQALWDRARHALQEASQTEARVVAPGGEEAISYGGFVHRDAPSDPRERFNWTVELRIGRSNNAGVPTWQTLREVPSGRVLFEAKATQIATRGLLAIVVGLDGTVRVHDRRDGRMLSELGKNMPDLRGLEISWGGAVVMGVDHDAQLGEPVLRGWELRDAFGGDSAALQAKPLGKDVEAVVIARSTAVYAVRKGKTVELWQSKAEAPRRLLQIPVKEPRAFGFAPNDHLWVHSGSTITLWDPATSKKVWSVEDLTERDDVNTVTNAGALIVRRKHPKSDRVGNLFAWERQSAEPPRHVVSLDCDLESVAVDSEENYFICGAAWDRRYVGNLVSMHLNTGYLRPTLGSTRAMALNFVGPHEELVVAPLGAGMEKYSLTRWSLEDGKLSEAVGRHGNFISAVASDGAIAFTASHDGYVAAWEPQSEKPLWSDEQDMRLSALAHSPNAPLLAAGQLGGAVVLFDSAKGVKKATLQSNDSDVEDLSFHPKARRLAVASMDKSVHLWDLETKKEVATLGGFDDSLRAVDFSPGGTWLAAGDVSGRVIVFDGSANRPRAVLIQGGPSVGDVHFLDDNRLLVAAGRTITTYLVPSGKADRSWAVSGSRVGRLAVDANGRHLAAATTLGAELFVLGRNRRAPVAILSSSADGQDGLVRTPEGYVQPVDHGGLGFEERLTCQVGLVGHPYEMCRERWDVEDLLAKVVAGDSSHLRP